MCDQFEGKKIGSETKSDNTSCVYVLRDKKNEKNMVPHGHTFWDKNFQNSYPGMCD